MFLKSVFSLWGHSLICRFLQWLMSSCLSLIFKLGCCHIQEIIAKVIAKFFIEFTFLFTCIMSLHVQCVVFNFYVVEWLLTYLLTILFIWIKTYYLINYYWCLVNRFQVGRTIWTSVEQFILQYTVLYG